jgi:hypothetical protein
VHGMHAATSKFENSAEGSSCKLKFVHGAALPNTVTDNRLCCLCWLYFPRLSVVTRFIQKILIVQVKPGQSSKGCCQLRFCDKKFVSVNAA